jgi:hypothetical protein
MKGNGGDGSEDDEGGECEEAKATKAGGVFFLERKAEKSLKEVTS